MVVVESPHNIDLVNQTFFALMLTIHELLVEGLDCLLDACFFLGCEVHLGETAFSYHLSDHLFLVECGLYALLRQHLLPSFKEIGVARLYLNDLAISHKTEALKRF